MAKSVLGFKTVNAAYPSSDEFIRSECSAVALLKRLESEPQSSPSEERDRNLAKSVRFVSVQGC